MNVARHTAENLLPPGARQFAGTLAAVIAGVALFGFLVGIREPKGVERPGPAVSAPTGSVPAAVRYTEMPDAPFRPNARQSQALSQLKYETPGVYDVVVRTEEMKHAALRDRAKNRAFDGAPPTVPHPIDSQTTASCLACHGEGVRVGDRVATKISHTHLTNCTQCHLEQSSVPVENGFVGVYRAGPGLRASPGAPPSIPHSTWMRENCTSCHGLVARPGIRTTHPWLTNCVQCHAPSAALDQLPFAGRTP